MNINYTFAKPAFGELAQSDDAFMVASCPILSLRLKFSLFCQGASFIKSDVTDV